MLESVVRSLLEQSPGASAAAAQGLPVVVDVEMEDARCLVIVARHASHSALSPREYEIAQMIRRGLPNKTIAANLGISSWTVSTHLRRMFVKLGVNSRAALVARIVEEEFAPKAGDALQGRPAGS